MLLVARNPLVHTGGTGYWLAFRYVTFLRNVYENGNNLQYWSKNLFTFLCVK